MLAGEDSSVPAAKAAATTREVAGDRHAGRGDEVEVSTTRLRRTVARHHREQRRRGTSKDDRKLRDGGAWICLPRFRPSQPRCSIQDFSLGEWR
jgi:hypothetical protein